VTLLRPLECVDLIDLDVQGSELDVLSAAIDEVTWKVKRLYIGTHSREIEEGLRRLLAARGWVAEFDYPKASEADTEWGRNKFEDVVQSWCNPALKSSR
jgi:hypothetical protein